MAAYCVHQYKYRFIGIFGRKRTQESLLKTNIVIKLELFALNMGSLTSQMKRMKLEEKVVTLLNPFVWDQVCGDTIPRRKIDFTCELDGMEAAVGELTAPLFYFHDEKKF